MDNFHYEKSPQGCFTIVLLCEKVFSEILAVKLKHYDVFEGTAKKQNYVG